MWGISFVNLVMLVAEIPDYDSDDKEETREEISIDELKNLVLK